MTDTAHEQPFSGSLLIEASVDRTSVIVEARP